LRAVTRIATGIVLVVLGLIGWLLPIVPGWPLLIPGLLILSDYIPPLRRLVDWAKAKIMKEKTGRSEGA
jgi:uncharacterized membrane protein YbaN (DUF454 family)